MTKELSQIGRRDLFSLLTLNSHFHGLASAEIYRSLDFNIISSETEDLGNSTSHAADALQTILASNYDYGQHIKSFRMGAVADRFMAASHSRHHSAYDDPLLMTRLLWDSKTDPSKFLNTALLLMARKTRILETFKYAPPHCRRYRTSSNEIYRWDAPIELSSAVYQALHDVTSLRHLLVRLDVQPSPRITQRPSHHPPPPGIPPGPFPPAPIPSSTVQTYNPGFESSISKRKKIGGSKFWAKRWAFSGFKYLHTLEVVGVSNLDCLPEIAQCMKASSANLKSLTLTLSSELALKARKPATTTTVAALDDDVSDTELDDDDFMDPPPPPASGVPQPSNEADIREEKLAQENILATVFDLQNVAQVGKKLEKKLSLAGGKFLEEEDSRVDHDRFLAIMESLKDSPLDVEQAKNIKTYMDSFIKSQIGHAKKSTASPVKSDKGDKIKEAHKALLAKKKHLLNANTSSFKPSGLSNEVNGFMDQFSSMESDVKNVETLLSSPYAPGSASGKSSGYGFPTTGYYGGSSSSLELPPINPSSLPNSSKESHPNGDYHPYSPSGYTYTAPNTVSYLSYPQSHTSSGSLTPTLNSPIYQPYGAPSSYSTPMYSPPFGTNYPNKSTTSLSKKSKQLKTKKHAPKKGEPPKPVSLPSSDDSEEVDMQVKLPPSSDLTTFPAKSDEQPVESMDIDVDHPDEGVSDPGEDQEFFSDPDPDHPDESLAKRAKRPLRKAEQGTSSNLNGLGPGSSSLTPATVEPEQASPASSPAEAMQDYIRVTHGLQLEELRLNWIPMKASIVGRALDLTVLKRITLLYVGPQDTFWALLVRLTSIDNSITFKSIHTDHVSKALTRFLATFGGLEELLLHERSAKNSDVDSEPLVTVSSLRKVALSNHVSTLKKLMIRNERDDSWDVDTRTLQFLAFKAKNLTELACSMKMQTYVSTPSLSSWNRSL